MKKPNIVLIMNDHQPYYRHGWDSGVKPKRPNFDRLASEGAEFTNAYCATPLCGPVRRTIINGLFAHTHEQHFNDSAVPYTEENYLNLLSENGYKNCYYGKWHAGPDTPIDALGCDGFSSEGYGNPYTSQEYKDYLKRKNLPAARHLVERSFSPADHDEFFAHMEEGKEYSCESSWCGEHAIGITVTPKETHEAFFLANLACDKLDELAKSDQPFHLRVDFWGPHEPYFPTQEFIDMYNPDEIGLYGNHMDDLADKADVHKVDVNAYISKDSKLIHPNPLPWKEWQQVLARGYAHVSMIDQAGGLVLDKLKSLGLDENTIIIWSTDHGDAVASHGGHFDKCSYMSQEVMRIPMAMKWKDNIKPNTKVDSLVSNIDLPISMLDVANLKFSNKVHGENLIPLAKGDNSKIRTGLMCETNGHGYVERIRGRMYVEGDFKYVWFENQIEELYNLKDDPYELKNIATENPDKLNNLKQKLSLAQKETNDVCNVLE